MKQQHRSCNTINAVEAGILGNKKQIVRLLRMHNHTAPFIDKILELVGNIEDLTKQLAAFDALEALALLNEKEELEKTAKPKPRKKGKGSRAKQVRCIETGVVYPSVHAAHLHTGIAGQTICKVCKRKGYKAGGYHWEYVEED